MNKDETDKLLIDMSGDIKVLVSRSDDHHETLYGEDGVVSKMVLLKERQDQCPARKATTTENKRLTVMIVTTILVGLAFAANIIFDLVKWKNESP